jgi:DNA polymerase III subunit alpha
VKDFTARMGTKVNRKALLALVHSGAFDRISDNRAAAAAEVSAAKSGHTAVGQMSMFDMVPELDTSAAVAEYDLPEKLDKEFDILGHYLSDHPLRGLRKTLFDENRYFSGGIFDQNKQPPRTACMPAVVCDFDIRITKKGDAMGVIRLSDPDGSYEALAFGETVAEIKPLMRKKTRIEAKMSVMAEGGERRLIIESVEPLAFENTRMTKAA